jgi:hypothetical protein
MIRAYITDWQTQFEIQARKSEKHSMQIIDIAADVLYNRFQERTPLGNPEVWMTKYKPKSYTPGRLKASWSKLRESANTIVLKNDAPYAARVEFGWSHIQRPMGMVRISIKEWPSILNATARLINGNR